MYKLFFIPVFAYLLSACAQFDSQRGVEVNWDTTTVDSFSIGKTTRQQVMDRLGPPSQLISLDGETVLYYLFEHTTGEGLILVFYNRFSNHTRYDRAVFIFNEQNVLTEYASHINEHSQH
ncbi:MAG: hypothetical protein ACK5ME_02315 [Parahaliea sp.]